MQQEQGEFLLCAATGISDGRGHIGGDSFFMRGQMALKQSDVSLGKTALENAKYGAGFFRFTRRTICVSFSLSSSSENSKPSVP